MNDGVDLQSWIGKSETVDDIAAAAPLAGLAALLDHATPPWIAHEVAPLGHWFYFLPTARQSQMDVDGHPRRGGFLPPVALPRRMWAGSRVTFHQPIALGVPLQRRSTIAAVASRSGKSGAMVFVTVHHEIMVDGRCAVREEQDIVYRERPRDSVGSPDSPVAAITAAQTPSQATREITVDPIQLFRFSALTFNAHRIHYDRIYTREIEGYPDLVVHGPFVAILLLDHFLRHNPRTRITGFTVRAQRPLYDTTPFSLCLNSGSDSAQLWAVDSTGNTTMTASLAFEPQP